MALELNGTTGVSLVQDGVVTQADLASGVGGKFVSYAVLHDEKSNGTDGGTFTAGSWVTRDLNTEVTDPDNIVTLSSNQFTLQAGTYLIYWSSPAYVVDRHRTLLNNNTDALTWEGSGEYCGTTSGVQTRTQGVARVTITSAKVFQIQHRCEVTRANNGLGVNSGLGGSAPEVYTIVKIYKEA